MNKVLISAKCKPESKEIIKKSKYTYGDCVDFLARIITNSSTRLMAEIKLTSAEIDELKLQIKKIEHEIVSKENYLETLLNEWELNNGKYSDDLEENQQIKAAVITIHLLAREYDCKPLDINKFTGSDVISFHAKKCGITRIEFEELLLSYREP
ncbi:hypothetical protein [Methanobacterium alcaliphilum]|uniref:hypothetical protein n=1 Tax=Methanobacterium alcaliphilum TaxID=392018 RepID=UPI00200A0CA3|nr:hypothetical protein [Methanobacterium alcaliphilum]MCK9151825.1 hypothetical protein [Methanobacterium alcaliphilum]